MPDEPVKINVKVGINQVEGEIVKADERCATLRIVSPFDGVTVSIEAYGTQGEKSRQPFVQDGALTESGRDAAQWELQLLYLHCLLFKNHQKPLRRAYVRICREEKRAAEQRDSAFCTAKSELERKRDGEGTAPAEFESTLNSLRAKYEQLRSVSDRIEERLAKHVKDDYGAELWHTLYPSKIADLIAKFLEPPLPPPPEPVNIHVDAGGTRVEGVAAYKGDMMVSITSPFEGLECRGSEFGYGSDDLTKMGKWTRRGLSCAKALLRHIHEGCAVFSVNREAIQAEYHRVCAKDGYFDPDTLGIHIFGQYGVDLEYPLVQDLAAKYLAKPPPNADAG